MFVFVFVVMMGFRRSVRMGSGVHAKKNLPHQLLKDKASLQSRNQCHPERKCPSGSDRGIPRRHLKDYASASVKLPSRLCTGIPRLSFGMTGAIERAII